MTLFRVHAQTQWRAANYTANESYPGNVQTRSFSLPALTPSGATIVAWDVNVSSGDPSRGAITGGFGTQNLQYTPVNYSEESNQFNWKALVDGGTTEDFYFIIDITPVNNPPEWGTIPTTKNLPENQNTDSTLVFTAVDYDSDAAQGELTLTIQEDASYPNDDDWFEIQYFQTIGSTYYFRIALKNNLTFNYETPPSGQTSFVFDLALADDGPNPAQILENVTINLLDVNERPVITSATTVAKSLNEDEDTETKQDFQPIQIQANDPEGSNLYWKYSFTGDANIGGIVKLNGTSLAENTLTAAPIASSSNIDFDFIPDANDYGTQTISFSAYDGTYYTNDTIDITFTIDGVYDDPISLNEGSSTISVSWSENQAGTLHDFNPTDADSTANNGNRIDNNSSSTEGARIYYEISGNDEEFFEISYTGVLTFKSAPNYESPTDETGYPTANNLEGDNEYNIVVEVRDTSDPNDLNVNTDSVNVNVTVTNVNELPTLSEPLSESDYQHKIYVTEDTNWVWSSDVSSTFNLIASDVDAGQQSSLIWRMKSGQDGDFGQAAISGTGQSPSSFSYTPFFDYDGSSGDDTFTVEIYDGVAVRELNFIVEFTPVSDPPRLTSIDPAPPEVITLDQVRYTVDLDENNPSLVRVDFEEADGDTIDEITFRGGEQVLDNEDFDLATFGIGTSFAYAEITFKSGVLPDYESPQDDNFDGNYSIVLEAKESTGKSLYLYIDFIIQNVDDAPTFSNSINFSPNVLENQTFVSNLSGNDAEGVTSFYWSISPTKDYDKFQLDINSSTASPTSQLTFKSAPDFENPLDGSEQGDKNNTYSVEVRISDAEVGGYTTAQVFTVIVGDDNDEPVFLLTTPASIQVNETDLTNADMDLSQYVQDEDNFGGGGPDQLIWQKLSGDTNAFSLDSGTGILSFTNLSFSDYEYQSQYDIGVRVLDQRGGYADRNFTIDLQDTNEAPQFFEDNESDNQITFLQFDLDEDSSYEFSLADYVRDPEASVGPVTISYTRDLSVDHNGTFPIFGQISGIIKYVPDSNFVGINYLTVTATDDDVANPQDANITIEFHVKDVSDAPVIREGSSPTEIGGFVSYSMKENNSTWKMELNASDLYDNPPAASLYWSLSGNDSSLFKLTPTEGNLTTLTLRSPPNFEEPNDFDADKTYDVTVIVTDSDSSSGSFDLQLNYLDDDEMATFDYGDGNLSVVYKDAGSLQEASTHTSFFEVQARDIDVSPSGYENAIIYDLTPFDPGNNDNNASIFSIDAVTGRISVISPLDFENGQGTVRDDNNSYVLEVSATTDALDPHQVTHLVYLSITNLVEPPVFDAGSAVTISTNENDFGLTQIDISTEDSGSVLELEISGGVDQEFFTLNVVTNELSFITPPDYENPTDSGGVNTYNVQVRIKGTTITQDLTFNILEANDAPTIENTGLTQVIVDENTGFVVDLEVSDQDSDLHRHDLLYHTSDGEIRFFAHTGDDSTITNSYTSGLWTTADDTLTPSLLVHGDFNKDGYEDIIVLEKSNSQIRHLQFDFVSGSFLSQPSLTSNTQPAYAKANDLDQDGDLDLVVSFVGSDPDIISLYKNDGTGSFTGPSTLWTSDYSASGQELVHFAIGDMDGDSFDDLVLARRTGNGGDGRVSLVLNSADPSDIASFQQGSANTDFDGDLGIVKPSFVELVDVDNSGSLDILVAGEDAITLLYNNGMGTNDKLSVTSKNIGQFDGDGFQVKAYDLTSDGRMDLVYTTGDFNSADGIRSRMKVLVQDSSGDFAEPTQVLPLHSDTNKALYRPENIEIYPAGTDTGICIVFTDGATGYLSLYEAHATNDGSFKDPVLLAGTSNPESGSTIESIALVDLEGKSELFSYSFDGGDDELLFDDGRFKDDGKLYFKELPDHEDPTDYGTDNFYEVSVKVADASGGSTTKKVTVYVKDVNDDPVISSTSYFGASPNSSWAFPLTVTENTIGEIADIDASNDEDDETVSFSISGGLDAQLFDINATSGSLIFLSAPDFEDPSDNGADNTYEVIVKATDSGTNPGYDEQNITIEIKNGPEPASFDVNTVTSYEIEEDTILWSHVITATDDAGNLSFGLSANPYSISMEPTSGDANFDANNSFSYVPNQDFYGNDSFKIAVTNQSGQTGELEIIVQVNPVNDPPSLISNSLYDLPESQQNIAILSATDDTSGDLSWSWSDPNFSDTVFSLTSSGELKFRDPKGVDFENPSKSIEDFLPTDATNLLLWLDADDNTTMFANASSNNPQLALSTVGRWKDKSGLDNNVSQTSPAERPTLVKNSINGLPAVSFDGIDDELEAFSNRLGLPANPDLMILMVSSIDVNKSITDRVFQLGYGPNGKLSLSAGTGGWAWRFGDGGVVFGTVATSPGLQVWERSSGTDYESSKMFINGTEVPGTSSSGSNLPTDTSQYLQIGHPSFAGKIGEFIVLNSTSSIDRQKLEGYLAHKWGLTTSLPDSHPHKYTYPSHIKWERSVRITDAAGIYSDHNFTIRVANNNDNVPVINNTQLQGTTKILHNESSHLVIDLNVTDADGDKLEYEIVGGIDKDRFLDLNMSESSMLAFGSADPDFPSLDQPEDLPVGSEDNIYEVEIEIRDGDPTHTISLALQVEIVKPYVVVDGQEITSGTIELTGTKGVYENNASVVYLGKSELWDNDVTFTTTGGSGINQSLFEVNASTNLLQFISPPDYETPLGVLDESGNPSNLYEVDVVGIDELGYKSVLSLKIEVLPVNEPPGLTTDTITLAEESYWEGALQISDPEDPSAVFDFVIKSSPVNGVFSSNENGTYRYEPKRDFFGTDRMIFSVQDQTLVQDYTLTFVVTPVEDPPQAAEDIFTYKPSYGDSIELKVLANDSNFPDSNDSTGLFIASFGQAEHGTISTIDSQTLEYTPSSTFLGLDSFQYTLQESSGFQSTGTAYIVVHEVATLPNWKFLKNFGFYIESPQNWIFHNDLGWLYILEVSKIESVTWMWQQDIGWFWTGERYAPDAYLNDFTSWFTFTTNQSQSLTWPIYNQDAGEWLSQENFEDAQYKIVTQKIVNDIASMSVEDKIKYIEESSHFTADQKNAIKFEFLFKGYSRTLTFLTAGTSPG